MTSTVGVKLIVSPSMTEQELIDNLSELSTYQWKALSVKMTRFYRKGLDDTEFMPEALQESMDLVEDEGAWRRIRQRVNIRRKRIREAVQSERRNRQKLKRTAYMREYMAMYRKRLK